MAIMAPETAAVAGEGREHSKGVLLAIAIILLWLASFAFFIAFEGQQLLGEQAEIGRASCRERV